MEHDNAHHDPPGKEGARWAGRDDCGPPEHPDLSWGRRSGVHPCQDPPRTHGPMAPRGGGPDRQRRAIPVEQTRHFAILPVSWEPGGDQVTPTIKLKRQAIAARYAQRHRVPVRRSLRGGASRRS